MIRSNAIRRRGLLHRLAGDRQGATLTEFGFVAPVLCLMIMGIFDMAHTQYTTSLVNGALQKAGRDLTLEGALTTQTSIDAKVRNEVLNVVPATATTTIEFRKLSHFDFSDIGEAEEFSDDNADGICNDNEVFVDSNGNGQWDSNRGRDGIGGARDAVLYTAVVTYPRLFPMSGLIGMPENVTVRASTVLRNQPYDEQDRSVETGNCT
ncbi:TadE/TadG family type IV pilus assembly protein [Erythrobacter dokdonensis]|uniref:Dihydrolipoamide acetyltransferase n=1 Tax=Erythrobacter dokdonensis DSW-74 TaxID=1300349 RepID=A0A1A7BN21_9SPHN|nr:TadE/TadG family type IV pilus assembly protein [Erythrobacter dokdonensis]OBV12560.1 Dihydrolipoamide acetyltransferase [Erythrobacter dokdonensis DSW-74]